MNKELQKKLKAALKNVEIDLELDQELNVPDDIKDLADRVENADSSYIFSLDDHELYLKLSLYLLNSDPKRAESFAKKALELKNSFEGFVLRGNALYNMKDFKGAIGAYSDALKYKKDKPAYHYKAKALKKRGMYERSLEYFSKAWEIDQKPEIIASYADSLFELGRIEEAKKYYDRADKTGNTNHKNKKIKKLLKSAQKKSLPSYFDKILTLDSKNIEAWLGKAESHWNLGEKEEALSVLNKALKSIDDDQLKKRLKHYKKNLIKDIECDLCNGSGNCPTCNGSGNCDNCKGTGNCNSCEGSGYCENCDGTTDCPDCDGSGKSGWFSRCETCGGNGICTHCNGHGMCETCDGTGDCQECKGNGNCLDCQGSGSCPECNGKGTIKRSSDY